MDLQRHLCNQRTLPAHLELLLIMGQGAHLKEIISIQVLQQSQSLLQTLPDNPLVSHMDLQKLFLFLKAQSYQLIFQGKNM